jgi:uncharacterized protein (UPF0548 family)
MARWRFLLPWREDELKRELSSLATRSLNWDASPEEMTEANGWTVDGSDDVLGCEAPGPPEADGLFQRARQALKNYDFSDPLIVTGHFDPAVPFVGRDMLLEIKVFGLRYLAGVRVHGVREESGDNHTIFGFRYDTLQGHFEVGYEWFLLTKNHATGEVWFKIEAHWQKGVFPNWWSRLGFILVGERFRSLWRHRAPQRLKALAHQPVTEAIAEPGQLAHRGNVIPKRSGR